MEDPYNLPAWNSESSSAAPSPAHMFQNASRFGIEGSQFMNVLGNMNIHPPPSPDQATDSSPRIHSLPSLDVPRDVYTDSGSYCSQLLRRGRGFPLYVPGPQRNLPPEYRRKGVAIGDVGRVTPEGIFDFFFNIYLPADHPINANAVPEGFSPLTTYISRDVFHLAFDSGSYVSTSSVHKLEREAPSSGLDAVFECKAPEGAVLVLPLGSHLKKLESLEDMRRYAAENAESWYKYVNGPRGRGLSNGSLYLVTGCEKSYSWGMAAFQDIPTPTTFQLSFAPTAISEMGAHNYRWMATGPARTKDSGSLPVNTGPQDQTLFIHGFSISLGTGIWGRLLKDIEIRQIVDSQLGLSNNDFVPYGSQGSSFFNWSFNFFGGGGANGGKQCALEGRAPDPPGVVVSAFPPASELFHPSQVIHERLLHKFPDADVIMSHDDDWRDIFRYDSHSDGQSTLESLHQVCAQFIETQVDGRTTVRRHGEWTALRRHGELQLSASPLSLDTPFSALYPRPTIPPVVRPSLPNIEPVSRKPWTIDSSEEEEEDYLHGPKLKQGSPNRPSFPSGDHRKSLHLSIPSLSISYDSHNTKHHRLSDGDVRGVPAYTSHGSPPIYTSHASPSSTSPAVKRSRSAEGWSDSERDVVLISSHIPD